MKKLILGISVFSLVLLAFGFYLTSARADDKPNHGRDNNDKHNSGNFNPDKQLSQSACGRDLGKPVIDVKQKVQNDVDSGFGGNWAFDYYTRHITVWQTAPAQVEGGNSTYCAIVAYDGNFYAVPGQVGPGNVSGALINTPTNAPVNGDMNGGYRAVITGTLLTTLFPGWPTSGNVGPTNYQCNLGGICPGNISWLGQYFNSSYGFDYSWWGWQYKSSGGHGTWVNECLLGHADTTPDTNSACLGSSGNIL